MERVSTGILALDQILEGGLPKGSTVLLVGRPGTGKTILAHQMMFQNANSEDKVLYLTTLSEPQIKIMRFQQGFSFYDIDKIQKNVIYKDIGSVLRRQGSSQAMKLIDNFLKEYQPKMIFIDTIKAFADIIPDSMEFREFVIDLSVRFTTWDCTTILLGEYSEQDIEIRPESAIADGIIYLYGTEEKRQQKRYIRILKMRGTQHSDGEAVFKISNHGIEVFPRLNPLVVKQKYANEHEAKDLGADDTFLTFPLGPGLKMLAQECLCAKETVYPPLKDRAVIAAKFEPNYLRPLK